jgi:heme A synthase
MTHDAPAAAAPAAAADPLARRLTTAAAFVCLLVIVAGANVTSTQSGDAIPTWPWGWLGKDAADWIELSHRYVAGLLILTTAVAAVRTGSPQLRRVAWAVFGLVVVQAVLGGVRVLVGAEDESHHTLPWLKIAHASLGQAIYPLAVAASCLASDWWAQTKERPLEDVGLAVMRAAGLALLFMFLQIVLGALGRHLVIPREVHAIFALIPMILAARLVLVSSSDIPRDVELFRGPSALMGFLTALQLALGIASYIVTSETPDPLQRDLSQVVTLNLHVGVSAAMTGVAVSVALRAVRLWGVPTDERVAEARRRQETAR